jgi:hypothetical protein
MKYHSFAAILFLGALPLAPAQAGNISCYVKDFAVKKYEITNCDFDTIKSKLGQQYPEDVWILKIDDVTGDGEMIEIPNEKMAATFKNKQGPFWKNGYLTTPMRLSLKANILEMTPVEGRPDFCLWIQNAKKTKSGITATYKSYKGLCNAESILLSKESVDNWIKLAN